MRKPPRFPHFLLVCLSLLGWRHGLAPAAARPFNQPAEHARQRAFSTFNQQHVTAATEPARQTALRLAESAAQLYRQQEKDALAQASEQWGQAARLWQTLGEQAQAGHMLSLRGRSLQVLSEYPAALEAYQQAAQAFQAAGERAAAGRCLFALSTLHGTLVELGPALRYHLQAVQLWSAVNEPELPLLRRYQSGRGYRLTGEWQKARATFNELLALARAYPQPATRRYYEQQTLAELGRVAAGEGQYRLALRYLAQALPGIQADLEHLDDPPFVLDQISNVWLKLGATEQAQAVCRQALQLARRLGNRHGEEVALTTLGQILTARGRHAEARAALTAARALNTVLGIKRDQPALSMRLAQLANRQGDLAAALKHAEEALAGIEELRAGLPSGNDMRAAYLATWGEAQAFRLDLLLQLHAQQPAAGYAARAFDAVEQTRARSLLERLRETGADIRQNLDPQLLAREQTLRQALAAKPAARALTQLLAEYDWVAAQIRQGNPRYAALTQTPPLKLAEAQTQLLDEETLLLEYALGAERSWLFAVTPQRLHTFALPPRGAIETLVRRYHQLLTAFGQPPTFNTIAAKLAWQQQQLRAQQDVAAQLSQMLLAPAAALLPGKRLLLVPDGALHYLPFGALPESETGRQGDGGTGRKASAPSPHRPVAPSPLIVNHEIITLPSASTLAALRCEAARRPPAAKTLAVLADPVFGRADERVAGKPAAIGGDQFSQRAAVTEPVTENDAAEPASFARLPASRAEAEAILALAPAAERYAALDFAASRTAALDAELGQYRHLHFATHGLLDSAHPELSGLVFSLVDRQGAAQNGYLRALDVFNLKLNAELVVLSGCRTALGKEINGEGLIGLTRAFLYAGSKRVLASLWQVNDTATAALMQRFYRDMLGERKLPPAAALRAAQCEMLQDPRWRAPYYWAAFALQGEW